VAQEPDATENGSSSSQPALGDALRRARLERRLSLTAVAAATGISASFLSVVENGRSDITVGRLVRLLRFYGVRLDDLSLTEGAPTGGMVVSPGERRHLDIRTQGVDLYLLTADTNRSMMPVLGIHQPGSSVNDLEPHDGEVFAHMLTGSLLFELEGHDPFVLGEGSSVYWPGRTQPRITNFSAKPAVMLSVVTPPTL
jgi:transcriptional regulator with XRE-family HTH domain